MLFRTTRATQLMDTVPDSVGLKVIQYVSEGVTFLSLDEEMKTSTGTSILKVMGPSGEVGWLLKRFIEKVEE
jgi:hypothetical protein